jgi:hypothetical protein
MLVPSVPGARSELALPFLVGFREELRFVLAIIWIVAVGLLVVTGWPAWLVFALWGSVTTIMLWPVGRRLGIPYLSYRKPLFILGVLSMAALPALGLALGLLPPNAKGAPVLARTTALLLVVAILTGFSIVAAAPRAIGRPLPMFFRPDILFGDGRVLATGIISLGLSFRFLLGDLAAAPPHLPAPNGNWWALLFAIGLGLVQIIPLRGMLKLRMRLARIAYGRWSSWWATAAKEIYLPLAALAVLYGFHNVFMGRTPLIEPSLLGLEPDAVDTAGRPGLVSMAAAAAFLVLVRGGYKRRIGDPFVQETPRQSATKAALLVVGLVWLFYSWGTVMTGRPFLALPLVNTEPAPLLIGAGLFSWGIALLGPIRMRVQRNQRIALVGQMASVLVPALPADVQRSVLVRVMGGLTRCSARDRVAYIRAMTDALEGADPDTRAAMAALRVECLAQLSSADRRLLMAAMDEAAMGSSR